MSLTLHGHPFSSYTWKALIALYEKKLPFDLHNVEDDVAAKTGNAGRLGELWPPAQFPVL